MGLIEGTGVNFYTTLADGVTAGPFTSLAGAAVDPDVITFYYWIEKVLKGTFVYTAGGAPPDPTYTIVRDGVGLYHAYIASVVGQAGDWAWGWIGQPGVSALDATKTAASCKGSFELARIAP